MITKLINVKKEQTAKKGSAEYIAEAMLSGYVVKVFLSK